MNEPTLSDFEKSDLPVKQYWKRDRGRYPGFGSIVGFMTCLIVGHDYAVDEQDCLYCNRCHWVYGEDS